MQHNEILISVLLFPIIIGGCVHSINEQQIAKRSTVENGSAPIELSANSLQGIQDEWRSISIEYAHSYNETRWTSLYLKIQVLSADDDRQWLILQRLTAGATGQLSVSAEGVWPNETERYPIIDMQPGCFLTDSKGRMTLCLGALGSLYQFHVYREHELLRLEGPTFVAIFERKPLVE